MTQQCKRSFYTHPGFLLGLAGVIPFYGLLPVPDWQIVYAAVILSFMGGVIWGWVLRDGDSWPGLFPASILPAILAWVAVVLPGVEGVATVMIGFVLHAVLEVRFLTVPDWYRRMRAIILPLVLTALGLNLFLLIFQ